MLRCSSNRQARKVAGLVAYDQQQFQRRSVDAARRISHSVQGALTEAVAGKRVLKDFQRLGPQGMQPREGSLFRSWAQTLNPLVGRYGRGVERHTESAAASRSGTGRWRSGSSAAGRTGRTGDGTQGEVGGVLADGGSIQGEHGSVALRGIGGRQLERRRPARHRPGRGRRRPARARPDGPWGGQGGPGRLDGSPVSQDGGIGGGVQLGQGSVALRGIGGWQIEQQDGRRHPGRARVGGAPGYRRPAARSTAPSSAASRASGPARRRPARRHLGRWRRCPARARAGGPCVVTR